MNANTGECRDPYSVTLKLKDGADAMAQQRHPVVMDRGVRRDDWLRGSRSRHAFWSRGAMRPSFCKKPLPKEGVGNAGRTMHPRSRVHLVVVKSTRVTTSTPKSPGIPARNGFNCLLRAPRRSGSFATVALRIEGFVQPG
jgi:hypothetical protein